MNALKIWTISVDWLYRNALKIRTMRTDWLNG